MLSLSRVQTYLYIYILIVYGSWKIAPEENCPPALILTLIVNQTLTLTGGNFPDTIVYI